ncbi:MAG: DNA methylase [Clostridiales bacterium]|nr:DNA methylase [Clostridiales bacterium]
MFAIAVSYAQARNKSLRREHVTYNATEKEVVAVRQYIAIDLKSFYASVECRERGLDPLTTHLVVADESRTAKTICLAVSPSLKAYGLPGRARLFEVIQKVNSINATRKFYSPNKALEGKSYSATELKSNPKLALDYVVAPPRMGLYVEYSTRIFKIYQKYVAPEDIHVYSIDEVFIDATQYLKLYKLTARELTSKIIKDVLTETGITATAGIGTNLYLCKVAMDIVAKHSPEDKDGVRIAELDELSYRKLLWSHTPLTDFWRVGSGYARKLNQYGLFTMGDVARCSLTNEQLLYKLFGINAELLIDHAWGYEPCTMADIKSYKPSTNSISSGQVLSEPYTFDKGRLIVKEMTDLLVLDLVDKHLKTNQMVLTVGYDIENLTNEEIRSQYKGEVVIDHYGRKIPKSAHGSINLKGYTSSTKQITQAVMELYDRIVDPKLLVRRMYVVANHVLDCGRVPHEQYIQMDIFTDYDRAQKQKDKETEQLQKEEALQETVLKVHKKYGKNALVKGMNLEEGATTMERNNQIGGHRK